MSVELDLSFLIVCCFVGGVCLQLGKELMSAVWHLSTALVRMVRRYIRQKKEDQNNEPNF